MKKPLRPAQIVRIGHVPVRIVHRHRLPDDELGLYSSGQENLIQIAQRGDDWQQASTLLHELLHFVDDVYGIGLTEANVRTLEFSLVSLIVGEQDLFDDLVARLRGQSDHP